MAKVPIGLQLFSVRGEVEKDLPATLESVASLGYVAAEPWGYDGSALEWMGHKPEAIRAMFDANDLTCCGFHLATDALLGDNLARTVEMNRILGNSFLIVAWDQPRMSSVDGIADLAGILNSAAEKVAPEGMFTGYHAHGFDFDIIDGEVAWHRLFSSTADEVIMQLDIGNCMMGGGDPVLALRKFPGRAKSVHLKDYGAPEGGVIGEGEADWDTIWRLCDETQPVEWYVVEEGGREGLGYDVCKRSLEALRAMGR